jgi:hypothetical protein
MIINGPLSRPPATAYLGLLMIGGIATYVVIKGGLRAGTWTTTGADGTIVAFHPHYAKLPAKQD